MLLRYGRELGLVAVFDIEKMHHRHARIRFRLFKEAAARAKNTLWLAEILRLHLQKTKNKSESRF